MLRLVRHLCVHSFVWRTRIKVGLFARVVIGVSLIL
jgi:hypothetical protein